MNTNKKLVIAGVLLATTGLAACQPTYNTAYNPWAYGRVVAVQPQVFRTEVTMPAYVDRFGNVISVDYNRGWVGRSGFSREVY